MSEAKCEEEKEQTPDDDKNDPKSTVDQEEHEQLMEDPHTLDSEKQDPLHCPEQEEERIKKKYGGLAPKKLPLISKDHDHAYFDSADWALGKQGAQRSKGPLEALRPKLQPTPHQQVRSRRSVYAPADDEGEGDGGNDSCTTSEEDKTLNDVSDDNFHPADQIKAIKSDSLGTQ